MYTCKECNKTFERKCGLSKHINIYHGTTKNYYDKWIKKENEGICKVCGKEAKFRNLGHGYNNVCYDEKCLFVFKYNNLHNGMIEKYGKHASLMIPELKEKHKKTCLEKYGTECVLSSKNIRNKIELTNLEKYGVKNAACNEDVKNKKELTHIEKYGVKCIFELKEMQEQIMNSMNEKYGVNYYLELEDIKQQNMFKKHGVKFAQQNKEIHTKQQINACKLKKYNNTNIYYRGSFELDFLNKYYDFLIIENGLTFNYTYNNLNKFYHSDFYIKNLNLIVEIKNSYLAQRDKIILCEKEKAVNSTGLNFVMIIDKDYRYFENLIK